VMPDYSKEAYQTALTKWKAEGGIRPAKRPDDVPTRIDVNWWTRAEDAISKAQVAVEHTGASPALTDAVILLQKARERVADHVEGKESEVEPPPV
jgi:hypothetical protein